MAANAPAVIASTGDETVFTVSSRQVACDGGGGALGHPKVFYTIGREGEVTCLYCDRRYVLDAAHAHDGH